MPASSSSVGDRYVLATGELGARRLQLLNEVYGPTTEQFLLRAGLKPGMRVADIGCGTGTVSCWLAQQVGPGGSVVGIDASPDQLQVARSRAAAAGLTNVSFKEGNAYATGLPRGAFDLAFTRLLLCHLNQPEDGVKEMTALLRSGGILACEDLDLATLASDPPTAAYDRIRALCLALGEKRCVDYTRGASLHRLFHQQQLTPITTVVQPALSVGEVKRVWEYTFLEAVPAMIEEGVTTAEEVAQLAPLLEAVALDPQTIVYHARFVQVSATKR